MYRPMSHIDWDDNEETWFCKRCLVDLPHGDLDIHEDCQG